MVKKKPKASWRFKDDRKQSKKDRKKMIRSEKKAAWR